MTGCLFSGILDVVKYFLKPSGPFFFGFTFNAMLASFMYGCFYYRKKLTIKRVLAAKFIVMLTVNVLLNTLWISMLYGKGIMVLLPARALKNLILWGIVQPHFDIPDYDIQPGFKSFPGGVAHMRQHQ